MPQPRHTLFFLGATGYIGGQFLLHLSREKDLRGKFNIVALVRNPTPERTAQVKKSWEDINIVEGDLNSDDLIQEQTAKADYVINAASSDHIDSIKSILAGLEKRSASQPENPPLFIQVSGTGILSDNIRGQYTPYAELPKHSDIGFDINSCPPTNCHVDQDKLVIAAGTRTENPIRTIIIAPAWVYGVAEASIQKTTLPLRIFLELAEKCGYAGTWGQGYSFVTSVHVKDVADAIVLAFKAALEGKADEGAEGIYFAASDMPAIFARDISEKIGNFLYDKRLVTQRGSQPMPDEVLSPLGHYGWSLFAGNQLVIAQRLRKLKWSPMGPGIKPIMDTIEEEIEFYLRTSGKIPS